MHPETDKSKSPDLALVAFMAAVFVFASPFHLFWMTAETPWYVPYLVWLCAIVMTGIVQHSRGRHEL